MAAGGPMLEIVEAPGDPRSLRLEGELDLATAPLLLDRTAHLVQTEGDITLVLSDVSFIDSQGIRGFIQIARGLDERGRLVLAAPSDEVRKLFEIVRLEDFPNIVVQS